MNTQATAAGLLQFLASNFKMGSASDEDLKFLSRATLEASSMASNLSSMVSGTSCLIGDDIASTEGPSTALRGDDLPDFLFHLSASLDVINQMTFISSQAAHVLQMRLDARASEKSRRAQTGKQSSQGGA